MSVILMLFYCLTFPVYAQPNLVYQPVITSGLSSPIDIVNAGDGTNRLFVVEQNGTIKIYSAAYTFLGTLLTVDGITFVGNGDERGLLSMVFHPDYETNRFFYVYYNTNVSGVDYVNVARYQTRADNPNVADDSSRKVLLTIQKPFTNHNGARLLFGPDGYLYFATGDGGSGGDPFNNAQNGNSLLGKMIRLWVRVNDSAYLAPYYSIPADNPFMADAAVRDEIYALGLRNPFRWSFDRATGDMWIADVGQDAREEINYRAAGTAAGVNYGWRCYEGNLPFNTSGCLPASNYVFPIYDYPNPSPGAAAVTGGHVYRGSAYPTMQGVYIAADVYSGRHYKVRPNGSGGWSTTFQSGPTNIVAFGEAENGELYAVNIAGSISQVTTNTGLPVRLVNFNAVSKNDFVLVSWKTAYEAGLRSFDVEFSGDGRSFQLAQAATANNNINGSSYSVQHFTPLTGLVYYRLKIINEDGSVEYSPIVATNWDKQINGAVIPGVVRNDRMVITLHEPFTQLRMVTPVGQTVFTRNIQGMTGFNEINLPSLPEGTYIIHLQGKERQYSKQVVVTR